jgi:hypothetical protein
MSSPCPAKAALLSGLRPVFSTQQQIAATRKVLACTCSPSCVYCDIWKLASLIASHVPLAARYNLSTETPANSPTSSTPSSPLLSSPLSRTTSQSTPYALILSSSKKIAAQMQTQKSRLSSILSICTVSEAEECEGLRLAHDRCSAAVEHLLDQEEDLEEALLEDMQQQQAIYECDYGYGAQYTYSDPTGCAYPQERRPSMIGLAI